MKGSFAILALVGNISAVNLKKTNMVQVSSEANAKLLAHQQAQDSIFQFNESVKSLSQIDSIQQMKSESEQQAAIERHIKTIKKVVKHVKAAHQNCDGSTQFITIEGENVACPKQIPDLQDKLTVIARSVPKLGAMEKKLHMMKNLEPELHHLEADLGEITDFDDVKAASIAGKKVLDVFHKEEAINEAERKNLKSAARKAEEKLEKTIGDKKGTKDLAKPEPEEPKEPKEEESAKPAKPETKEVDNEVKEEIKKLKEEVKEIAKVEQKQVKEQKETNQEEKETANDAKKAEEVKAAIKEVGEEAKKVAEKGDLETANKMIEAGTNAALKEAKEELKEEDKK